MTESKRFSREIKRISQNFAVRPNEVIKRNTNDGNLSLTFKSTDFDDKELLISDKSLLVNSTINKKHKSLIVDGAFQLDLNKIDLSIIKLEGDSTLIYVENFDEGKIYQIIIQQNQIGNNNFTIHENLLEHVVLLGDGISLNSEPNSLTIFNLTVANNKFFIEQENNYYKKVTNNPYGTFSFTIDTTLGSNAGPSFELGLKDRGFDSGQYIKDGEPADETPYYIELNYDFIVDWGDGETNHITSWEDINKNHNYSTNGEYQISISGLCEGYGTYNNWWEYNNTTYDQEKIIRIDEIGYIGFKDLCAFMGDANNLTNINNISSNAFKDVIIMNDMFYECNLISTLDVSNWNVSNVTNMKSMFGFCSSLTTLDVSNWNVSNVTDMSSMFYICSSLTTLDVSNWNVSNVINIRGMFSSCSSLTTLDVSNWNVSNVTDMANMFNYCESLTTLDVSNWNVSNVTDMGGMFYQCTSLTTLDVSNWNVSNVIDMNSMFNSTPLDTPSYDALLIGWSQLPSLQPNIAFVANLAKYSAGAATTARGILTSTPNNWTIIDGGQVAVVN